MYTTKSTAEDGTKKPDYPSGYWYTASVNANLKRLSNINVQNYHTSRLFFVYNKIESLLELVDDVEKCKSIAARDVLKREISNKLDELRSIRIFDDKYDTLHDEGF